MLRRLVLAALCCSGLVACEANMPDYDYRERYPIKVEQRVALLVLDPGPGGTVMAQDLAAVNEFATDYGKRSAGAITIDVGANSRSDPLATHFGSQIVDVLAARGIPRSHVTFNYVTDPEAAKYGRAVMQFPIYVALVDECGTFKDQPGFTPLNENSWGFGCANQRNLAAMVVNPRDLIDAQASTGRLGARSDVAVGRYIAGVKIGSSAETPALTNQSTTGGN